MLIPRTLMQDEVSVICHVGEDTSGQSIDIEKIIRGVKFTRKREISINQTSRGPVITDTNIVTIPHSSLPKGYVDEEEFIGAEGTWTIATNAVLKFKHFTYTITSIKKRVLYESTFILDIACKRS